MTETSTLRLGPSRGYRFGLAMVAVSAVAWSAAGFFTRFIPLDTATTLFWRGIFGTLTGLVFVAVMEGPGTVRAFRAIGRTGLLYALLSTAGMIAFIAALKLTTVAHVAVIFATIPFVAACLAWVVLGETVSVATLAASAVALVGVALAVSGPAGDTSLAGDLLAFAMTLLMAGMIVTGRANPSVPLIPAACLSALLSALVMLPFASLAAAGATDLVNLALFGASNMGLGLIAFTVGAKYVPAAQTALVGALDTPLAPLWVWLAFGETPPLVTVVGGALVLAAVCGNILVERGGQRAAPEPVP